MSTLTATAARPLRRFDGLLFHAGLVLFIVATQVMYTPARDLGPDNTWHYRMAKDIVSGEAMFWAGLDGNRLFPDLIFALGAFVLSGGALFAAWLPYFYILFFLATYAALVGLAPTLYAGLEERRAFVFLSVAGLWLFTIAAPFWARWFFDPGNHGTGLPVALGCVALLFLMNRERRFSPLAAAVVVGAAALLVGSNRFLLLGFLLPLLLAFALLFLARIVASRRPGTRLAPPDRSGRVLLSSIATVAVAALASYAAYKWLSALSWHRSVTYMGVGALGRELSFGWALEKLRREAADFAAYAGSEHRQVVIAPLLMLASLPASAVLFWRALRAGANAPLQENRALFGLFTALSAVFSVAFVVWGWEEANEWRYRYLAMPCAFVVVFLAMLLVRITTPLLGRPGLLPAAILVGVVGLTAIPSFGHEARARAERNARFLAQVDQLKQLIAAGTGAEARKGLGEYWLGMDTGPRAGLRVDVLDPKAQFEFYNNNAGALCSGGYTFVLRKTESDAPKRAPIVALLGEPKRTDVVEIEGHGKVEAMYFDPGVIDAKIVTAGKEAAGRLFPSFRCPS